VMGHWSIRGYGFFSLEHKKTGQWVGRVGPWYPEGWPSPEIGWTISPDHVRKGYATEAARACIDYAYNTLGWSRLAHVILKGNEPSIGVARAVGSTLLGEQQGLPGITDKKVLIFGQTNPTCP